jgi:sugar phosphate permease
MDARAIRETMGKTGVHYGWVIVGVSFLTLFLVFGTAFSIGLYFQPLIEAFGWSRTALSLGVSIFMLSFGFSQPMMGRLIDRHGPRAVLTGSLFLMGLGIASTSRISEIWHFYLTFGVLGGIGFSGAGALANAVVVSRWFTEKRGLALGVSSAGTNVGQLFLFPLTMALILAYGWSRGFLILGLSFWALIPLIHLLLKDDPSQMGLTAYGGEGEGGLSAALDPDGHPTLLRKRDLGGTNVPVKEAIRSRSFWLLALGFFACGFTAHGIFIHLPLYILDLGFPEMVTANLLGLIGGVSILGVLLMGGISDRLGRKNPLAATYLLRGLSILWLLQAREVWSLALFVIVFGFSYFATVPLVSGAVADLFGSLSMGGILGLIWLSHAMGQAVGPFVAGFAYDHWGSYTFAFLLSALLLFLAAALSYCIEAENDRAGEKREKKK